MLERERDKEAKCYPEGHAATEGDEKDADAVEDRAGVDLRAAELAKGLVDDDSDCII